MIFNNIFFKEIKPLILASPYKFWQSHMSYRDFCHFEVHRYVLSEKNKKLHFYVSFNLYLYKKKLLRSRSKAYQIIHHRRNKVLTLLVYECNNIVLVIVGMCANCWRHIKHSNIWHNRQLKANKIKWPIKERNRVKM